MKKIAILLFAVLVLAGATSLALQKRRSADPLAAVGIRVSAGAAPGYVDDDHCAVCHADVAQTYRHVGMAKSFFRPRSDKSIEAFDGTPFRHELSGDVMDMRWHDGRLVFRRWQIDSGGKRINSLEQPVDWILGSGHNARTYLYQTPSGELYQLPIAWYSQAKEWAMAPGFDRRDHQGVLRRVRHECLFCHNGYPEIAENHRDGVWRKQGVPPSLPEGTGCQRCHGPGAEHMRQALSGNAHAVRTTIVNPGRLEAQLRNDVCYECHMQPSVAMSPIRRLGRDIYSFRPGRPLPEYLLQVDIADRDLAREDRFEINHHAYRLEQSRCFLESAGKLSCLSCHHPHRKVTTEQRADHYRAICQQCHAADVCSGQHAALQQGAMADCVSCHMPRRRTQDVVHVMMTDHRIGLHADSQEKLAPREERNPVIAAVELADLKRAPPDAEMYRLLAAIRADSREKLKALRRLEELLAARRPDTIEPYLDLATEQLQEKRYSHLEKTAQTILTRVGDHPLALEWLGIARANLDRRDEGIDLIRKAAKLDPQRVETLYNLALLLVQRGNKGDLQEAIANLQRAVEQRPNFVFGWFELARAHAAAGNPDHAVAAFKRSLEIEPRFTRGYLALADLLLAGGNRVEALHYLRHGAAAATSPTQVRDALSRVEQ